MHKLLLMTAWLLLAGISPVLADDISIYGGGEVQLPPNVMIILDNSGSMDTNDVPGEAYDKNVTYPGTRTATKVYKCTSNTSCSEFAPSVSAIACSTIKNDLTTKAFASGRMKTSAPYNCGGRKDPNLTLRTGNYANYLAAGLGAKRKRLDVAKEVVTDLIEKTPDVRFGLFKFNNSQGGSLVKACGTSKADLLSAVNDWTASTWTPLAETLAETGLYFAGKPSWFNSGVTYSSPMQYRCQKNYILLVTDGEPTEDKDSKLATGAYINGDTIGDQDGDGKDPGNYGSNGSDYLDDVAYYLYYKDTNPSLGRSAGDVDDRFEKQQIRTYTVGFQTEQDLLEDAASNGGGLDNATNQYFTASNAETLGAAFESIFQEIGASNAVFVAPVVPVNQLNRAFSGNKVYLGFFRPEPNGRWSGNLKSYKLTDGGELLDMDDQKVVDSNGQLKEGSWSRWSASPDGSDVKKGGAGASLVDAAATRKIYTYLGASAQLSAAGNAFIGTNTTLTNSHLGVATAAARTSVINDVRGEGIAWPMGDIVHSEPVVVHYGSGTSGKAYIFVGANDGMLHAFDDSTGKEVWGFVPPGQLGKVQNLAAGSHNYYVDGSPVYFEVGSKKVLMFGERRGGENYYALDITDPLDPRWLYQISAGKLSASGSNALLGKSWSRPQPLVIKSDGAKKSVFLLTGGYDLRQDTTPAGDDSAGRAIYAVDALTGALTSLNINGGNWSEMKNSILDVGGFDRNEDAVIDLIYAGDLGGRLFAMRDPNASGSWQKRVLFTAPGTLGGKTMSKKFMYAPAVTKETFGEYVFAGTGDRENPTNTSLANAFYAIKSDWTAANPPTLTIANLTDVSSNAIQGSDGAAKILVQKALKNSSGWYFTFPNLGEKLVASPLVFDGIVYFTTYTPSAGTVAGTDPCAGNTNRGTARLYAIDYLTGGAAYKYASDSKRIGKDVVSTPADRSKVIGTGIPSQPQVVVLRSSGNDGENGGSGGTKVLVGVEGGVVIEEAELKKPFHTYFWQQLQ